MIKLPMPQPQPHDAYSDNKSSFRLNHLLPWYETRPKVMQRTANFHPEIPVYGSTLSCLYCSLLRHGASELSILGLTKKEVSHAPTEIGYQNQSDDRHRGPQGQAGGGAEHRASDQSGAVLPVARSVSGPRP